MAARFATPSQGSLNSAKDKRNGKKPIAPPPQQQPTEPLLGRIDLSLNSKDGTPGEDGLVAEISTSVYIGNKLYKISSGGSTLVTLTEDAAGGCYQAGRICESVANG